MFGMKWILENLGPKPGPCWEMHVLKTSENLHGYFGPGGLQWRPKADRHDAHAVDVITEWTNTKWEIFKKQEDQRRADRTPEIVAGMKEQARKVEVLERQLQLL